MTLEYDKDYFIGKSKGSYEDYAKCDYILYKYAQILNRLFSPISFYDAGCAYGFSVKWFNSKGVKASGCDISDFAVEKSNGIICKGDIRDIPSDSNQWDLVTSAQVLEHLKEKDIPQAISELVRISDNWIFILTGMFQSREGNTDITHKTFKPRQWWEELVAEMGLARDIEKETQFDNDPFTKQMGWDKTSLVIKKRRIAK